MNKQSQYSDRILELKDARKEVFGMGQDIEAIWKQADYDYIPHQLSGKGKKILAKNEELGWASRYVEIGKGDWQTINATVNPYIKIQTALSILIAKNPGVELSPAASKYENSTLLQKELYKKSWEQSKGVQQLKLFAFNLAKYGWAIGRTYPYQSKIITRVQEEYDPDNPYFSKTKYETKEASEYNGVYRESLDPWLTWIDDKTKPNMQFSTRDWVYAKLIPYKTLEREFGKSPNWKRIKKGNSTALNEVEFSTKKYVTKDMKVVHFYENLDDDVFTVICDDTPLLEVPLPIANSDGKKFLSMWQTYWTLRHANSPMGIGINEAIRQDKNLYDKMRNMTVDQIILSIYKMFFYSGTDQLDADGVITIKPGLGKAVTNPENLKWLDVPGPGQDGYRGIEMMQNAIDEASAVTKPLTGQEIGKTAFEAAQASEFSLRRLATPLGNITDALEQEAELTLAINAMIYSVPEVIKITNPQLIKDYFEEIQGDSSLYERDGEDFYAKLYPEIQMGLDKDEEGRLMESEESRFFRIHPKGSRWEGTISIKGQSILVETKVLQKAQTLEVFNMIIPLLQMPKELVVKPIKQLLKKYDLDWRDWVPDMWLQEQPEQPEQEQGLFVSQDGGQGGQQGGQGNGQTMQAQSVLPKNEVKPSTKGLITQNTGQMSRASMSIAR